MKNAGYSGIYIHIPFCRTRCIYCDFLSGLDHDLMESYVELVIREAGLRGIDPRAVSTLYIGGGTPSLLPPSLLLSLRRILPENLPIEVTMEANSDDVTMEMAERWREAGVNRLSIGIQSMVDEELSLLSRRNRVRENIRAMEAASAIYNRWSVDILVGIPRQTRQSLTHTLEEVHRFTPLHLSLYALEFKGEEHLPVDPDRQSDLLQSAWEKVESWGYRHYEVSNFCLGENRSLHNLHYWKRRPYIGLGMGAHMFDGKRRAWNTSDFAAYRDAVMSGSIPKEGEEYLSGPEEALERLMLGLRLDEGVERCDLPGNRVKNWIDRGWAWRKEGRFGLTDRGFLLLDSLLDEVFDYRNEPTSGGS